LPALQPALPEQKKALVIVNEKGVPFDHSMGMAGRPSIDPFPLSEIAILSDNETKNNDGSYSRTVRFTVLSAFAPAVLAVSVSAPAIISADLRAIDLRTSNSDRKLTGETFYANIVTPMGKYDLSVTTPRREPLTLRYAFD
jgi:hypothetical protein